MTWVSRWVLRLALVAVAGGGWTAAVFAQGGMPGAGVGYNAVVGRLLADVPAFSAAVETALTNTADKSRIVIPMKMQKRESALRIDVDFVKMKGSGVAMQGLAGIQNIGMARMTSLVSANDRTMRVLFPDLKFHTQVGLSDADLPDAGVKLTKKAQGKETINGQPCVRQLVTITSSDGKKNEATTWEAPALGNFPVRIAFRAEGSTVSMTFANVSLEAPGNDQFQVPADYRGFDSVTGLMQEAMTRAYAPGTKK